jgi:hypothetical protein
LGFTYAVRWPYSETDWQVAHNLNDGRTLREWHAGSIRSNWRDLPRKERAAVNHYRRRSYGYNPIDDVRFGSADLSEVLGPPDRGGMLVGEW